MECGIAQNYILRYYFRKEMDSFNIKKALLLEVDLQNDFCPAYMNSIGQLTPPGALAVNSGDKAIPVLNTLANAIIEGGGKVAASQDWHPATHISFASNHKGRQIGDIIEADNVEDQVLWPDHCIQGSWGAKFHESLDINPINLIIRKGFRTGLDSYSTFFENDRKTPTGLEGYLRGLGITHIIIGGLATDYCVFYSVVDAINLRFNVIVVSDAIYGVDYPKGSTANAVYAMEESGAVFLSSKEILHEITRNVPSEREPLE